MTDTREHPNIILIVDDMPQNLQLLGSMLEKAGYETVFASSGAEALALAAAAAPDLILLDVMMPEMDGYEVCRRLKAGPATREIPVIFLTARTESEDVIAGFAAGGVDYVAKPFHDRELLARVRTHIGLQRARAALASANATKEKFLSLIAHDLRGPLGTLAMGLEAVLSPEMDEAMRRDLLERLHAGAKRLFALSESLLDWARMQREQMSVKPVPLDLLAVAREQAGLLTDVAQAKNVTITVDDQTPGLALADVAMMATLVRNLLGNAIKFTPAGGTITVSGETQAGRISLGVRDTGVGMSAEQLARLFDLARITSTPGTAGERGSGLGLIMCREFARRNQGELAITSEPGQGTVVRLTLPAVG